MSYVDRLLLTLPSGAPQIADWFTGAAALTTSALPGWLPTGAIHLRLHSLCVAPQGCSAPAELHRLDGAAGVLVGSEHNLEHLANWSNSSEQLLRAHRRLGERPGEKNSRPSALQHAQQRQARPRAISRLGQPRPKGRCVLAGRSPRPWFPRRRALARCTHRGLCARYPGALRRAAGSKRPSSALVPPRHRAWRLWAARHFQEEAVPLDAQPVPRLLELAASGKKSIVAHLPAFDHPGRGRGAAAAAAEHRRLRQRAAMVRSGRPAVWRVDLPCGAALCRKHTRPVDTGIGHLAHWALGIGNWA